MKRIALLTLASDRPGDPQFAIPRVEYRLLVEAAVRVPLDPQKGASIDEMRKGIRVLDALDRAIGDAPLELEDADWEFLKSKVEKMPWSLTDHRFVRFYDDVMGATEAPRDPTRADGVAAV